MSTRRTSFNFELIFYMEAVDRNSWIMNSGASIHMTICKELILENYYQPVEEIQEANTSDLRVNSGYQIFNHKMELFTTAQHINCLFMLNLMIKQPLFKNNAWKDYDLGHRRIGKPSRKDVQVTSNSVMLNLDGEINTLKDEPVYTSWDTFIFDLEIHNEVLENSIEWLVESIDGRRKAEIEYFGWSNQLMVVVKPKDTKFVGTWLSTILSVVIWYSEDDGDWILTNLSDASLFGRVSKPHILYDLIPYSEKGIILGDLKSVEGALNKGDADLWKMAFLEENESHLENDTRDLMTFKSSDQNAINCKLVSKTKRGADGTMVRHWITIVIKGFEQQERTYLVQSKKIRSGYSECIENHFVFSGWKKIYFIFSKLMDIYCVLCQWKEHISDQIGQILALLYIVIGTEHMFPYMTARQDWIEEISTVRKQL